MTLNWNFQKGGVQTKKPSVGGVWIFSGTTHCYRAKTVLFNVRRGGGGGGGGGG